MENSTFQNADEVGKSKYGEVFISFSKNLVLFCSFCHKNFKALNTFCEHVLRKHIMQNARKKNMNQSKNVFQESLKRIFTQPVGEVIRIEGEFFQNEELSNDSINDHISQPILENFHDDSEDNIIQNINIEMIKISNNTIKMKTSDRQELPKTHSENKSDLDLNRIENTDYLCKFGDIFVSVDEDVLLNCVDCSKKFKMLYFFREHVFQEHLRNSLSKNFNQHTNSKLFGEALGELFANPFADETMAVKRERLPDKQRPNDYNGNKSKSIFKNIEIKNGVEMIQEHLIEETKRTTGKYATKLEEITIEQETLQDEVFSNELDINEKNRTRLEIYRNESGKIKKHVNNSKRILISSKIIANNNCSGNQEVSKKEFKYNPQKKESKTNKKSHEKSHEFLKNSICSEGTQISPKKTSSKGPDKMKKKKIKRSYITAVKKESFESSEESVGTEFSENDYKSSDNNQSDKSSKTKFFCDLCKRSYATRFNLNLHLSRHENKQSIINKPKPFQCHFCPRKFIAEMNRRFHERLEHHGDYNYKCRHCGKKFLHFNKKRQHEETHTRVENSYKCDLCSSEYAWKKGLIRHQKLKHSNKDGEEGNIAQRKLTTPPKANRYKCDLCDCAYAYSRGLSRHKRQKHNALTNG